MAASSTLFPDPNFFLPYYLNDNNNNNNLNNNNYLTTSHTQLYSNYSHNYNYNYSDMDNLESTPLVSSSNPDDTNKMVRKRPASEMDQPSPNPTPNRFLNRQNNDLLYNSEGSTNQGVNDNNEVPLVCGFSGLPLFPPVINRDKFRHNNNNNINNNNQLMVNSSNNNSLDDPSWVDGIIKDLIQSSNSISIPQLIQNVRDIIYPCNPNLGAVIEYRLRSLAEPIQVGLPTIQQQQQQPQQQIISSRTNVGGMNAGGLQNKGYFGTVDHGPNVKSPVVVVEDSTSIRKPPNNTTTPAVDTTATAAALSAAAAAAVATTASPLPQQPSTPPAAVLKAREKETLLQRKRDEEGLHLLTLLLQCAEAVSSDNSEDANKMLVEISEWATPFGTSAQRVAAYFSLAMSARLISTRLGIHSSLPVVPHYSKLVSAFQVFNGISPFVKFSHFTANQAIQEAFQREDRVHIIDLDIMQGLQWPGLFHILASRPGGPPFVRLTGLGTSLEALEATGKRLTDFAEKLGLPFEYIAVADKIGNLDLEKLHVSKREAVAVHWLQHSLYDVTGSDTNTLRLLQR